MKTTGNNPLPLGWREVIDNARDSIGAGADGIQSSSERSIVEPHLDAIYDELERIENFNKADEDFNLNFIRNCRIYLKGDKRCGDSEDKFFPNIFTSPEKSKSKWTWKEVLGGFAVVLAVFFVVGWMQGDDEAHREIDRKAVSDLPKLYNNESQWDALQAQSNTYTGHAGIKNGNK